MSSDDVVAAALERAAAGASKAAIARELGVARSTVRGWLNGEQRSLACRDSRGRAQRCDGGCVVPEALDGQNYAYLLGQYLGDGCISAVKRSFRLRLTCCDEYPGIMDECEQAIRAVRPEAHVHRQRRIGCTDISNSWHHWPCLLPHGAGGVKHRRVVFLADWQREFAIVEHPEGLVRGLIHSDGWRGTNRVRGANGSTYEYPRYMFSNRSREIRQFFVDGCDRLGVETRQMNAWTVSVAKRSSVAMLDRFVGAKY